MKSVSFSKSQITSKRHCQISIWFSKGYSTQNIVGHGMWTIWYPKHWAAVTRIHIVNKLSIVESSQFSFFSLIWMNHSRTLKLDSHLQKRNCVISFIESTLKMMKNAFLFHFESLFRSQDIKFLSWLFGHVQKTAWLDKSD